MKNSVCGFERERENEIEVNYQKEQKINPEDNLMLFWLIFAK